MTESIRVARVDLGDDYKKWWRHYRQSVKRTWNKWVTKSGLFEGGLKCLVRTMQRFMGLVKRF